MSDKVIGDMAEDNNEPKPGINLKKLLLIAFIAVNFITVGSGAYLVYAATLGYQPKVVSEAQLAKILDEARAGLQGEPVLYAMETFNTNLDGLPRKFIRLEVNVEMYSQEGFEELVTQDLKSRDAVMHILNGKTFDDLETVQGKLHLKNEIVAQLNELLQRGVVKNVYFTKFQVQ
jgi:flagellar protein FliL